MKHFQIYTLSFILSLSLFALLAAASPAKAETPIQFNPTNFVYLPILTKPGDSTPTQPVVPTQPTLAEFVASVTTGQADVITGVYVADVLNYKIVQQPGGNAGYISGKMDEITQFDMVKAVDVIGLLAHNYAAGTKFPNLAKDQIVTIIYGNGAIRNYKITASKIYQALSPTDPYTDFQDPETGAFVSGNDVFVNYYMGEHHVTFQTCVRNGNDWSWGRLFVTATPVQ